ncbi:MAG TPA: pseudouridine synthase [Sediminibacterium sp.]|uniref:pseudouridine synthase n=1 Tax=Sediminibacterium sp. TaxID=1917865 RepID=UPI0008B546C9|nr:pseudouridine synthase [Sediminibacterium sp.]OHC84019.1 MAG: pseudouridine synthase [Sphingobacteriia bacterium RIFOXYC2_FULL_35_18]OHC87934.1 MAG: pseudouridine synthase [Sphingobacteriia bacterium RIFOXYD2_FULL_35_12]HLD52197.1 pseudouridine synthase [Sediminibacterium sp.]
MQHQYFLLNKPYNMVSQFKSSHAVRLLGDLHYPFPEGTHAIGRLDHHSEGLLLLTTNKKVTRLLFQGAIPHKRGYHVLVNNHVSNEQLTLLSNGVQFKIGLNVYHTTSPCEVAIVNPPIVQFPGAYIESERVAHTWLSIELTEGKYHQVRKMLTAVQLKCKRLVRVSIENLQLGNLAPGQVKEIQEMDFFDSLKITNY